VRLGVGGWWLDGGEGPPAAAKLAAGDGTALHNIYDRFRHQAFAEGEAAARPDQRVFLLCRSGAAGMQRFGASCWSGDINNDFATLEAQVPLGLNTGLSGVPYWGTDVGGFFHTVRRSRRSAGATPSFDTGSCRIPTRSPGRRTRSVCR
jgi:alpha-D-xyloside xylohydrolase